MVFVVQIVVNLTEKANKAVGIVKATYGLKNKAEAVDLIVEKYAEEILEPELKQEYIERIKKAEKGEFVKVKDFKKLIGLK